MAESGGAANDHHEVTLRIANIDTKNITFIPTSSPFTFQYSQKVLAEFLGTYFLVFAGCGAIMVDVEKNNLLGQLGIAIVWGAARMVMVYAIGHVSGAHINPAVTIAFASCKRFPWKEVPGYVIAQFLASTLACEALRLVFNVTRREHFIGNVPPGSDLQSLVMESIITFYLMFVISAVITSGGLRNFVPISGASMNPARSVGPAIVWHKYKGLWVYILGPTTGAIGGAWAYNTMRFINKPLSEITKVASQQ